MLLESLEILRLFRLETVRPLLLDGVRSQTQ